MAAETFFVREATERDCDEIMRMLKVSLVSSIHQCARAVFVCVCVCVCVRERERERERQRERDRERETERERQRERDRERKRCSLYLLVYCPWMSLLLLLWCVCA